MTGRQPGPTDRSPIALMPFADGLGITIEHADADRVVARLPWRPGNCTAGGILHGGALMALADSAGALCAYLGLPDGAGTATTTSTTHMFRPVRASRVTATAAPVHRGRTTVVVRTDMTDDQGRLVAQTVQVQAVISSAPAQAGAEPASAAVAGPPPTRSRGGNGT